MAFFRLTLLFVDPFEHLEEEGQIWVRHWWQPTINTGRKVHLTLE
jgi:hypothetical protein